MGKPLDMLAEAIGVERLDRVPTIRGVEVAALAQRGAP